MKSTLRVAMSVLCAVGLVSASGVVPGQPVSPARALAPTAPPGFSDTVVGRDVGLPTGLTWTPDGRMLVISKEGKLWVVEEGEDNVVALDLAGQLCSAKELGLVGMTVDPEFETNRFVYLFYTNRRAASCVEGARPKPANRVGRFVLRDDNTVAPSSEKVIVDHIVAPGGHHIGGDLEFGANGYLYISVGDGICSVVAPRGCGPLNRGPQLRYVPQGKILRVDRNGFPPATNPFAARAGSRRCTNPAGVPAGTGPCKEIFALGFRNPFRFARMPGTSTFYVNDVGANTWEEVDHLVKGGNYGWSVREGPCATGSTTRCGSVAPYMNPVHSYRHTDNCRSITGGAFVPEGLWPGFDGSYLYSDYACGKVFRLDRRPGGGFTRSTFMSGAEGPVHLRFGPYGDSQALYYLAIKSGTVHRVTMVETNTAPVAGFGYVPEGRVLSFSGAASEDPDSGDRVTSWNWDFGDGTPVVTTTVPRVEHTYAEDGPFEVSLTVADSKGLASEPATETVHSGEHPPTIVITGPDPGARFRVGQSLTLSATATDAEEGSLPGTSISWTLRRQHANHFHPFLGPVSGASVTDRYPSPEDLGAAGDSSLIATATATDSRGHTTTVSQNLLPRKVVLRFATVPKGGRVFVEGTRFKAPARLISWAGHVLPVRVPDQRIGGKRYVFKRWSDGKPRVHSIVTPFAHTRYVATLRRR